MEQNEKLEFLLKMIDRYDNLRGTISNRAAIILSTNALFLGAVTFMIDKFIGLEDKGSWLTISMIIGIMVTLLFLIISIYKATSVIANIKKRTRTIFKDDSPQRLYFHAKETVKNYNKYEDFKGGINNLNAGNILDAGTSELWALQRMYVKRYGNLSKAIKYLFWAIIPFILTLVLLLISSVI